MGITYCYHTDCSTLECVFHQFNAPKDINISIADRNLGCLDTTTRDIHIENKVHSFDIDLARKIEEQTNYKVATKCIICGDEILVSYLPSLPKVCESCKQAVKFIRKTFKEELND